MALNPSEQDAVTRLGTYNAEPWNPSTNAFGMGGNGYKDAQNVVGGKRGNYPQSLDDVATATEAVARETLAAAIFASNASASATVSTEARDAAVIARNAAEAAAVSVSFPFGVTTGTSTAYLLDFDPDQVTAAGSAFRVQFHTSNEATPTLSVDGGTAAEIVNQAGQSLNVGDIATNRIYMVIYDAALSKWSINNFVANEFIRSDETTTLTVGYDSDVHDLGTITAGTVTPNAANGNKQKLVNGGAFTLSPPSTNTDIQLKVTNNGSAGVITPSGFTRVAGDALNTTNGNKFVLFMTSIDGDEILNILALQ